MRRLADAERGCGVQRHARRFLRPGDERHGPADFSAGGGPDEREGSRAADDPRGDVCPGLWHRNHPARPEPWGPAALHAAGPGARRRADGDLAVPPRALRHLLPQAAVQGTRADGGEIQFAQVLRAPGRGRRPQRVVRVGHRRRPLGLGGHRPQRPLGTRRHGQHARCFLRGGAGRLEADAARDDPGLHRRARQGGREGHPGGGQGGAGPGEVHPASRGHRPAHRAGDAQEGGLAGAHRRREQAAGLRLLGLLRRARCPGGGPAVRRGAPHPGEPPGLSGP
mmetsp:Transcript_47301/g.143809  ORF Transcript_47301/g.143809 Transcript_47301/m.143809 type:complete len:281 (-) Transcript_47301:90-932(-)